LSLLRTPDETNDDKSFSSVIFVDIGRIYEINITIYVHVI